MRKCFRSHRNFPQDPSAGCSSSYHGPTALNTSSGFTPYRTPNLVRHNTDGGHSNPGGYNFPPVLHPSL